MFRRWPSGTRRDPILKERLFGLTGPQGNHGEDVKECYYYLDSTPTHSYMRALYQYPQGRFPYEQLVEENRRRSRQEPEFELADTGVFDDNRYFDVVAEYAKALARRHPDPRSRSSTAGRRRPSLHLLPTLWFRNTWIWGCAHEGCWMKPLIRLAERRHAGDRARDAGPLPFRGRPGLGRDRPPVALHRQRDQHRAAVRRCQRVALRQGRLSRLRDRRARRRRSIRADSAPRRPRTTAWRSRRGRGRSGACGCWPRTNRPREPFGDGFEQRLRRAEAARPTSSTPSVIPAELGHEERLVARQAYAGLLWSKQFYHYVVRRLARRAIPTCRRRPSRASTGRNADWRHLFNRDVLSDARQMGIPLVRGVGPGVSHDPVGPARPDVRQGAAHALAARVVHAPQRADSRPTSSTSATSTRRCMPGPAGGSTR